MQPEDTSQLLTDDAAAAELAAISGAKPDAEPESRGHDAQDAPRRLTYLPAFRFVFENRDWFSTIVFSSVIGFLPVLGQIAHMGFYYEIVESLHRQPTAPYPKFEFRRFGDYCTRGVWPYVLAMMVGLMIYMFAWVPTQLTFQFTFMFLINNAQVGLIVLGIVAPVVLFLALLVVLAATTLSAPFLLRAGLTQSFPLIFRFDWCKGYIKRVWVEEILATLFLFMTSLVLVSLGCCVFLYGAYAAGAIITIASANIRWQIYEIYLERGGEPIPLHPLPAEAPPVQ